MNLIERIKRDRQEGTPGQWIKVDASEDDWYLNTDTDNSQIAIGTDLAGPIAIFAVPDAFTMDAELDANVNRALSVDSYETALLAAERMAEAADWFAKNFAGPRGAELVEAIAVFRETLK